MEDYILMSAMYPTMTSGKVDKFLVNPGDKVIKGMPVCEIISEGYFTLLSEVDGRVKEYYVSAVIGSTAPILFIKINVDPAISSGPFVTVTNDIAGIAIYLLTTSYIYSTI